MLFLHYSEELRSIGFNWIHRPSLRLCSTNSLKQPTCWVGYTSLNLDVTLLHNVACLPDNDNVTSFFGFIAGRPMRNSGSERKLKSRSRSCIDIYCCTHQGWVALFVVRIQRGEIACVYVCRLAVVWSGISLCRSRCVTGLEIETDYLDAPEM